MKLYHDPVSTTSRPVTLLVETLGLPVEMETVSILGGEQNRPAYLAVNPKGLVPALELEPGIVLTECTAILQYLACYHAPELYPCAPLKRARVNEMLSWFSTDLHLCLDVLTVYPQTLLAGTFSAETCAEMAAFAAPRLARQLDLLDRTLSTHPFVAGEAMTIADFLGVAYVTMAELVDFDFGPWPAVCAWIARMKSLSGWDTAYAAFEGLRAAGRLVPAA
ncbi:glutathione S-transferase family protein [Roseomonas populi]|uniref:Glutathione S-transferase family protein n=1 Tax=Roseomonas populi TaxID=3121582 RepID=A0ABT1XDD2_9PROT|nr:glutathione S-transferase family protein [Roseomonas pecuniae]MCR0984979.1 glutathione S-transferase family protein [Roseomonas pecuniae]